MFIQSKKKTHGSVEALASEFKGGGLDRVFWISGGDLKKFSTITILHFFRSSGTHDLLISLTQSLSFLNIHIYFFKY